MIYEYHCIVCDNQWDEEQKISDPPITTCPKCLVASAKRVISGGQGFLLRGSGWAKDNYAKKKNDESP